jgi:phage-related protein
MRDEWAIEFYVDESRNSPVENFLRSLDEKTQARFILSFEKVRLLNVQAREPLVRHLEGKIWEIRVESNTNIYRVLYFFFSGKRIVLLHGFTKKTQKLPHEELDIAKRRLARFLKQEGK